MKKNDGFWASLEKYGWRVVGRSPLPRYWTWMGIGGALLIMVMSWSYGGQTVVGARDLREVIEKAAKLGDYETARELFGKTLDNRRQTPVLGTESGPPDGEVELEDKVYPEQVVARRIVELEDKLGEYPGNRQIYLVLADLYGQLGDKERGDEYREKARILDPNN